MERSSASRSERVNLKGWRWGFGEAEEFSGSSGRRWRGVLWKAWLEQVKVGVFLRADVRDMYCKALKPRWLIEAAM